MSDDDDTPVCPKCKTQTIAALHGQLSCVTCHRLWDGSERGPVDNFPAIQNPEAIEDVVMDILGRMWRAGRIEEGVHGN